MKDWMQVLAEHYEQTQIKYPSEPLAILFDIDGTILDLRHTALHILQAFDRANETKYFTELNVEDIMVQEDNIESILNLTSVPNYDKYRVLSWYMTRRWSAYSILQWQYPVEGAFDVIRWFQQQPSTFVGLNTSRPESIRSETLRSLNQLGKNHEVFFASELLHMNHSDWHINIPSSKVAGVKSFHQAGFRVFAMVDNELENLEAISVSYPENDILLLHANPHLSNTARTESRDRSSLPLPASGVSYDISAFYGENLVH